VSNGGAIVRWARTVFAGVPPSTLPGGPAGTNDTALPATAEAIAPGSEGLLMLPFLLAEHGPLWDPHLRGAYLGIRHHHTSGHFVRAAVEGVALQLATILDGLDRIGPVTSVRGTGGVFRSALWRDVVAGVLDRPLTVTGGAEGSALGAAALGLHAVGAAPDPTSALALLAPDLLRPPDPTATTVADPMDVAGYRRVRRSVTGLLGDLTASARLLSDVPPPAGASGN
jgi:gluconokinase